MSAQPIKVALLGAGVVGTEVARLMVEQADDLGARVGAALEIVGVGVRRASRERVLPVDDALVTTDLPGLLSSTKPDIVVEVMGGIEPARELILQAFDLGASVVTANKALLAQDGATLHEACARNGVDLYYEASVAGAIPLMRPLRESLVGDRVQRVMGIVNGTTNYILTRMDEAGVDFAEALAEAKELGYAEADPSADIEGHDAAAKAAIIASLAFHSRVSLADVHCEGITSITPADMSAAKATGHVIKLLAIAERASKGRGINVRVHPTMLPRTHPLAGVREAYNAVFVESEAAGQLMFYGRGAGGAPTASAILGDIVSVARNRISGGHGPRESTYEQLPVLPIEDSSTRYYLSLDLADQPGVLAAVAAEFATHGVSIETLRQDGHGEDATLLIVTHTAREGDLAATIDTLRSLDSVRQVASVMRVVGSEPMTATTSRTRQWRGVIEEYRDRLPVTDNTPIISLGEGGTPLIRANVISERTGCEVWLKVEGANPTGSFKDRGMTMAISKAAEAGAQAVICASTGNTSASAAAYAVRARMICAVLVPDGKIAMGKMSQALAYGARLLQVQGNFDDCLKLARELSDLYPVALVNSVNPVRLEGQKTAAFEIVDSLGDAPDIHALPVGNAGNISAYWKGYTEYANDDVATHSPRMWGFQAAGAAPIVNNAVVDKPSTIATAIRIGNPASWQLALNARDSSDGVIESVTDRDILSVYRMLAAEEGVFVEPASAAGVAGLLRKHGEGQLDPGQTVVCTVTGNGLKDPDWAIAGAPTPTTVPIDPHAAAAELGLDG